MIERYLKLPQANKEYVDLLMQEMKTIGSKPEPIRYLEEQIAKLQVLLEQLSKCATAFYTSLS